MDAAAGRSARMDLAHEPDFRLGELHVSPSACRVRSGAGEQRLEPRVMEVLVQLARAANHTVTREELIEACWGGRFVSDDAITRVIAKVRDLARETGPASFRIETLPKVGFRLVTPGAETAGEVPGAPAVARRGWRRPIVLAGIALAALFLAIGGLALWRTLPSRGAPPPGQNGRVEVILFQPLRPDPDLQRLSVALGDALVRMLASNGVETAEQPSRRDAGGRAGGAEIRVAGSVDRDGDKYVVNAQVLDRRSGQVMWSVRFDRSAAKAASFQEEAASRIADTLQCALIRRARSRQAMSPSVFGLFMSACEARRTDSPRTLTMTSRLVEAAPQLSVAHSMHGLAQAFVASERDSSPEDIGALRAGARASANRALKLDGRNGEAYLALALSFPAGGQWREREGYFRQALQLDPDLVSARNLYVDLLREVGRVNEAIEQNVRTVASDPMSTAQPGRLATMVASAGDLPRARDLVDRLDLTAPESAREYRLAIALWWEDPAKARRVVRDLGQGRVPPLDLACFDAYLERLERAKRTNLQGLPAPCAGMVPDYRIRMLAREGDLDGAYREVAGPFPPSRQHTIYLFYPEMKAFRRDPRFWPLARRLGLVEYWQKTDRWPDFCAEQDLPFDCRRAAAARE